jgi:hypothetical protein
MWDVRCGISIYKLQRVTAKRNDSMTPKAND